MFLWQLDRGINDLMAKAQDGEATEEEIQFLKNLYHDLWELIPNLKK
jgi:hypothetical protein